MKLTVVPAQVTTVEDRIIGSLGFSQIILLVLPVFASAGIFALVPPLMSTAPYKYVLMTTLILIFGLLAIRIRGKIVAAWLTTILRFNLRPKYYVFNKNTSSWREEYPAERKESKSLTITESKRTTKTNGRQIDVLSATKILSTLENPSARAHFETNRKGKLYVRFTEIED